MVSIKSGCGHFMSKTEHPGLKWSSGINSAAQKTTILMKVATEFAKKIKFKKFTLRPWYL